MKSTGFVRKVDNLGRIVIPMEIRRKLRIDNEGDALEIFIDENIIMLKKYEPSCMLCGNARGISQFKGHNFCKVCVGEISKIN